MSKKRRSFGNFSEADLSIQMAPFMDIVLVLLVVFMVATPAVMAGIDVTPPEGGSPLVTDLAKHEPITVSYTADKRLFVDDKEVSHKNFLTTIAQKTGGNKNRPILIKGDKNLIYGEVVGMIAVLNNAGYKQAVLITTSANNT